MFGNVDSIHLVFWEILLEFQISTCDVDVTNGVYCKLQSLRSFCNFYSGIEQYLVKDFLSRILNWKYLICIPQYCFDL